MIEEEQEEEHITSRFNAWIGSIVQQQTYSIAYYFLKVGEISIFVIMINLKLFKKICMNFYHMISIILYSVYHIHLIQVTCPACRYCCTAATELHNRLLIIWSSAT